MTGAPLVGQSSILDYQRRLKVVTHFVQSTCRWSMCCKAPDITMSGITSSSLWATFFLQSTKYGLQIIWSSSEHTIGKRPWKADEQTGFNWKMKSYLPSTSSFMTTEGGNLVGLLAYHSNLRSQNFAQSGVTSSIWFTCQKLSWERLTSWLPPLLWWTRQSWSAEPSTSDIFITKSVHYSMLILTIKK